MVRSTKSRGPRRKRIRNAETEDNPFAPESPFEDRELPPSAADLPDEPAKDGQGMAGDVEKTV